MMLIEETTVPDAVLPVDEFKAHLRVGLGWALAPIPCKMKCCLAFYAPQWLRLRPALAR